ncbi:MAG: sigma-70 family RNA polymerase sigma factor [Eubacterium sp.]|nr:sigma-70 family RNA polymerase sigma factor [Eubacterium sp.]MCR4846806.1 sigma-70 family RNA polymerase sigma factor [Eubacterium sp.]
MTKYNMLSDDDLLRLIKMGDKDAEEYLIIKYTPLVNSEVRTMFLVGAEIEDLAQEGMIGLFQAIRDYSEESNASFSTFAYRCIKNRCMTAITSANRKKHSPLNTYISIFYNDDDADGDEKYIVSDEGINNPESLYLRREKIEKMYEEMEMKLSFLEKKVVEFYLEGLSRREIAERLGKSEKSVDNALTRIHNKLKD